MTAKRHELSAASLSSQLEEERRCEIAASYSAGLSDKELAAVYTLRGGVLYWSVMDRGKEEQFEVSADAMKRYNELP